MSDEAFMSGRANVDTIISIHPYDESFCDGCEHLLQVFGVRDVFCRVHNTRVMQEETCTTGRFYPRPLICIHLQQELVRWRKT